VVGTTTPGNAAPVEAVTTTSLPPHLISLVIPPFRGRASQSWDVPVLAAALLVLILGGLARLTSKSAPGPRKGPSSAGTSGPT
jgi:hypothetical protein